MTDEGTDESEDEASPKSLPKSIPKVDHHSFILGYRSSDVDLRQCHPLPSHIPFLWSVYQENVEPLIKVVHVPSVEHIFREARRNSEKLSPAHQALVFAIYYSAVTSLEPDEVISFLPFMALSNFLILNRCKLTSARIKRTSLFSIDLLLSKHWQRPIFSMPQISPCCKPSLYSL